MENSRRAQAVGEPSLVDHRSRPSTQEEAPQSTQMTSPENRTSNGVVMEAEISKSLKLTYFGTVFSFQLSSLSPPRSRYTLPLSQISSQPLNCTNNDSQNLLPLALLFTSSVIDSTITTSPTGAHVPSPSGKFGFDNKCTLSCSRSRCKKMCLKLCGICCGKCKVCVPSGPYAMEDVLEFNRRWVC
ncbi:hypothetical protein LXL04_024649 [Taraxacum kok-saghyz]